MEGLLPPSRSIMIRYEDLASSPGDVLSRVMEFLGAQMESVQLDHHCRSMITSMLGRREHARLGEPVTAKTVGRYRIELDSEEVASCEQMLGEFLVRYGYSTK